MLKKVPILKQYKGGDGRYRPGYGWGAIDVSRIVYMEKIDSWQDKSVTSVHLDNGDAWDVLLSIEEIIALITDKDSSV